MSKTHSCVITPDDFEGVLPNAYKRAGFSVTPWPCHAWREKATVYARRNNQTVFICESLWNPESDCLYPRFVVRPDGHITEVLTARMASQASIERYMTLASGKMIEKLYWLIAWKTDGLISDLPEECEVLVS